MSVMKGPNAGRKVGFEVCEVCGQNAYHADSMCCNNPECETYKRDLERFGVLRDNTAQGKVPYKGSYWFELFMAAKIGADTSDGHQILRLNGQHWIEYGDTPTPGRGRRMMVRLSSGEVASYKNVWSQGEIPDEYRYIMKDNATFVTPFEILRSIREAGGTGMWFGDSHITLYTGGIAPGYHVNSRDGSYNGVMHEYDLVGDLLTAGFQFNTLDERNKWDAICRDVALLSHLIAGPLDRTKADPLSTAEKASVRQVYDRITNDVVNHKPACICHVSNWASLGCPTHGLDSKR